MKNQSVKLKITLLLTLLMTLLCALMLLFLLLISRSVLSHTSAEQLQQTLRRNAGQVSLSSCTPSFGETFRFYENGVYTLVYSRSETLLAGQLPTAFPVGESFQNGKLRTITVQDTPYLILDVWVPSGWESGLWLRGLLEEPAARQTSRNLLTLSAITMPLLILLSGLGAYRILRRSLKPLDTITVTAVSIGETKDLSRRIGLPAGKDEFSRLAATFDQLFARLEQSFENEKQFTADASHELRTPITVILGACDYGQKYDETTEEYRETLNVIQRQAGKMSHLVSQLLQLTRLEQGTETIPMEKIDICELLQEFAREQTGLSERLLLEIPKHTPSPLWIQGNRSLLLRLVQNLVDNAFKYSPDQGRVWLSPERHTSKVLIQVRDEGMGIPPEKQDKIWQRFYQADPSRSDQSGAGLGLAMVQQIAHLHGGYMTLESTPGQGSIFTLHLPLENFKNI